MHCALITCCGNGQAVIRLLVADSRPSYARLASRMFTLTTRTVLTCLMTSSPDMWEPESSQPSPPVSALIMLSLKTRPEQLDVGQLSAARSPNTGLKSLLDSPARFTDR